MPFVPDTEQPKTTFVPDEPMSQYNVPRFDIPATQDLADTATQFYSIRDRTGYTPQEALEKFVDDHTWGEYNSVSMAKRLSEMGGEDKEQAVRAAKLYDAWDKLPMFGKGVRETITDAVGPISADPLTYAGGILGKFFTAPAVQVAKEAGKKVIAGELSKEAAEELVKNYGKKAAVKGVAAAATADVGSAVGMDALTQSAEHKAGLQDEYDPKRGILAGFLGGITHAIGPVAAGFDTVKRFFGKKAIQKEAGTIADAVAKAGSDVPVDDAMSAFGGAKDEVLNRPVAEGSLVSTAAPSREPFNFPLEGEDKTNADVVQDIFKEPMDQARGPVRDSADLMSAAKADIDSGNWLDTDTAVKSGKMLETEVAKTSAIMKSTAGQYAAGARELSDIVPDKFDLDAATPEQLTSIANGLKKFLTLEQSVMDTVVNKIAPIRSAAGRALQAAQINPDIVAKPVDILPENVVQDVAKKQFGFDVDKLNNAGTKSYIGQAGLDALGNPAENRMAVEAALLRARLFSSLADENPEALNTFISKYNQPKFSDYMSEYYYNALLSGIDTHVANIVGNAMLGVARTAADVQGRLITGDMTGVAAKGASLQAIRDMFNTKGLWGYAKDMAKSSVGGLKDETGRKLSPLDVSLQHAPEGIGRFQSTAELLTQLYKDVHDTANRLRKDELLPQLTKNNPRAFSGVTGTLINVPTSLLKMEDVTFGELAVRSRYLDLAWQDYAKVKGTKGVPTNFGEYFKWWEQNKLDDSVIESAKKYAEEVTLRSPDGWIINQILKWQDQIPALQYAMPFVRFPIKAVSEVVQHVPGANLITPETRDVTMKLMQSMLPTDMGKNAAEELSKIPLAKRQVVYGKMIVGTELMMLGAYLASNGQLTGSSPGISNQYRVTEAARVPANSILIDGDWVSVNRLGPPAQLLTIGADIKKVFDTASEGNNPLTADKQQEIMNVVAASIAANITSPTGLSNFAPLIQGLNNNQAGYNISHWGGNLAQSFVPGVYKDVVNYQDPVRRERNLSDPMDAFSYAIGLGRKTGMNTLFGDKTIRKEDRDLLGMSNKMAPDFWSRMVVPGNVVPTEPVNEADGNKDYRKVAREWMRLGARYKKTNDKFNMEIVPDLNLGPEESEFKAKAQFELTKRAYELMNSEGYKMANDYDRIAALTKLKSSVSTQINAELKRLYPELDTLKGEVIKRAKAKGTVNLPDSLKNTNTFKLKQEPNNGKQ